MASLVGRAGTALMGEGRINAAREVGGRLAAVQALYRLHARRVYTLCLRLLAEARAAEEATAAVFVRLGGEAASRRDEAETLDRLLDLAVGESISRLVASYREGAAETERVARELHDRFGIEHATLQVENGDPAYPCSCRLTPGTATA